MMKYTTFGNTDLVLSRIGLGLAALGRPGYINLGHAEDLKNNYDVDRMRHQTHQILEEALRRGINYFDAARSYGKAEEFLSSWLQTQAKDKINIGSKWGYFYNADWSVDAEKHEIKEHTLQRLNDQWPQSEKLLAPHLRLYQIHSATIESGVLKNTAVLDRLDELKSSGILIGVSFSGPDQRELIDHALKVTINDRPLFDSIQVTYNCLEQSAESAMQRAHDLGLGIIVKEVLANGRLTARNTDKPFVKTLEGINEVSPDATAISFVLSQPFVHVVLSGAATRNHLISNINAISLDLNQDDIKKIRSLRMSAPVYWKERSELDWN